MFCPYCNHEYPLTKHRRKCGCPESLAAKRERQREYLRDWYRRNKETHKANMKAKGKGPNRRLNDDIPVKKYPCKKCKRSSVNRFYCPSCLEKLSRNNSIFSDLMGQPLSPIWL